jgi:hypothetical protein
MMVRKTTTYLVTFQVLMAVSMTMAVFWDVALYSLLSVYQRCFAPMMEAASTSETSVNFNQTTWYNIPKDSHLQTHNQSTK